MKKVVSRDRWFHVEGFYNLAAFPLESLRKRFDGPEILYKENVMLVGFDGGLVDETLNSKLKGKGFSRLRDAKPVKQNELDTTKLIILIKINNNTIVKQSNANTGGVTDLSRYSSIEIRNIEKLINVTYFVFHFLKKLSCKIKKQSQCFKEELVSIEGRKEAINQCIKQKQDCLCQ